MSTPNTTKTPVRFDENMRLGLLACGYVVTHHEAHWEDDGDAENGPHLSGCPAYDEWREGGKYVIVENGWVVESGVDQELPNDFPF